MLQLVSHLLCPYVQRAAIVLSEKGIDFERVDIDLANKPDWFLAISPLGKVPVLRVGDATIFESSVILEYLEETESPALLPAEPLRRATHRAWTAFASSVLDTIAGLYSAGNAVAYDRSRMELGRRLDVLENHLVAEPWFDGQDFSLVDAAFAPVFRYFDVLDRVDVLRFAGRRPRTARWRADLSGRPSVAAAVPADYPQRLAAFLASRGSHLSSLL